jgi:peptidoglycan/xylan/chitin deacetylase (PgdA/CDA1 family)
MALILLSNAHARPLTPACNCVIFHLDDIRDDWLAVDQIATMELFKNDSLTIGNIANLFGNNSELVGYVRNNLDRPEVANLGWNHEDFAQLSFEEQKELMAKANMKIEDAIDVKPRIFIPPYNEDNLKTTRAAGENGIAVISSWEPLK